MDFNKKYKLKRQYHLDIVEGGHYIVSYTNVKCAFLNPLAAVMVKNIIAHATLEEVAENVSQIFKINIEDAKNRVQKLMGRLDDFFELDFKNDSSQFIEMSIEEGYNTLTKNREYVCPITKEPYPRKLKFYLTDYCPRRCIYCFAGAKYLPAGEKVKTEFLSVERFKEIILEARDIGVPNIEISGGDPFVLDNITDYLKVMIDYFPYDWGTSTKSFISLSEAEKLKAIGLKEMQVSLDSLNPNTADKLMGVKGAYDEVISTINNLMTVGITVVTKATITSQNIYDIPFLFVKLIDMGIKHLRFSYYYISANRHKDMLYPSDDQFKWLNENMIKPLEYAEKMGVTTDYYNHEMYDINKNDTKRVFCGGFVGNMCVRYDGGVLFCDSLNHCDEFIVGNLKEKGILEIWNSKEVSEINDPDHFKEKYKGTKCYTCHMYRNCFYKRCYVRSFTQTGKYFDVDPACPFGDANYIIK